ncbi:protein-disulfide reductase DsbD domain-containing protein [Paraflavisolibacter sp. H34]|uniref:protein-disulfide reductase DsbD domain-containing protein n=1 Tax=Huijunlia imazamoxiresistens TaxID=3127457 RepID=UPI00301A96F3
MKKALFLILFAAIAGFAFAQAPNPVSWSFSSKKLSESVYEVHLVANIQPGWHLYSQNQPQDAIALPTAFNFNKHPLLTFDGTVKELGKLEKFKDDKLGISANQFSQKVDFVQKVKIKGKVKTNVTGKLEYQTCDDKKCLPPKTVNFTIALS